MASQSLDQHTLCLQRRDDLLVLQIAFTNITLVDNPDGTSTLKPTVSGRPGQLTIVLPPQAVLEQAIPPEFIVPVADTVSSAQFSNTSQLVFDLPSNGLPVHFTAAGLLTWAGLVHDISNMKLECVWGLAFKPAMGGRDLWLHNPQPDTYADGVTSLWHSSLMWSDAGGTPDFGNTSAMPLTADATGEVQIGTYITALNGNDGAPDPGDEQDSGQRANELRAAIAESSKVKPLDAREVTVSALGATIDLAGQWSVGQGSDGLLGYRHRAVLGRDQQVVTVQQGLLLPFGFSVKLQEVTERTGVVLDTDFGAAVLCKTDTIIFADQLVAFDGAPGLPSNGRLFPFRTLRVHERSATVTPVGLAPPVSPLITAINIEGGDASSDDRYLFHFTAEDYGGNSVDFVAPGFFVPLPNANGNPSAEDVAAAITAYDGEQNQQQRSAAGRVAMAIESPSDTAADVTGIYVGAMLPQGAVGSGSLAGFPRVAGFDARIPAIDALSPPASSGGTHTASLPTVSHLVWPQQYIDSGLNAAGNPGKVFAQLKQAVPFGPKATGAGGLANLNTPVVGLSQATGLVGGATAQGSAPLGAIASGVFDPKSFFPSTSEAAGYLPPTLLGFIKLADLVQSATVGDGNHVPQITTALLYGPSGTTVPNPPTLPTAVRTSVTWQPLLKPVGTQVGNFVTTQASALDLNTTTTVSLDGGGPPVTDVRGALSSFELTFASGLVTVIFDSLAFSSHAGAAPKIDVKIKSVKPDLGNALAFFQQLLDNLPGAGNVPKIDFVDNSLTASYSLAVPSIPMGAFLMQNLAVSSSVTLPLDGRPVQASFAFASRDHPFLVTVSLFGGGGFLALNVVGDSVQELDVQLDFGAAASLDLIVASASVVVTAGIYVSFTQSNGWSIDGFFRANGQIDLLGIISVSLEIYLALEYDSAPTKRFIGTAEFTLRVQVAFFSQSLSFAVSRSFSAGADPTFDIAFPSPQPWAQRCAAFASMVGP